MDEITKSLISSLASGGVPGAILVFILVKIAPAVAAFRDGVIASIGRLEEAVDRSTRADLLRLVANPLVADTLKEAARGVIQEIDLAEKARQDQPKPKPATP